MIDLSRKLDGLETTAPASPSKSKVYYPTLHISSDQTFEVPKGVFMAKVKLKKTGASESEDENGKKHYSCTYDVMGIEPGECCDEENDSENEAEGGEEEPQDAAMAIMHALRGARNKKMMAKGD